MFSKVSPELKTLILELPQKEKDKLLLRLIRKDKTLIQQLHFQLLEGESDLEDRRKRTLAFVNMDLENLRRQVVNSRYTDERMLLLALRSLSGHVNHHALITKDKTGELELRLHIITGVFKYAGQVFAHDNYANDRLLTYAARRIKNIYDAFQKLHEDLQFDYAEELNEILVFAYSCALKRHLQEFAIPEEI